MHIRRCLVLLVMMTPESRDLCRCVTVMKNEVRLHSLMEKYEKAKLKLEDLTDKWISRLRRKKHFKRKQVHPCLTSCMDQDLHAPCTCSAAGVLDICSPQLCVQIKVKPNPKDESHSKKWGTKATTADEMEWHLWLVQDCFEKLREGQEIAKGQVRSS
jgi:hypothetical protein